MGTSRGISTPTGGAWGTAKREVTSQLANPSNSAAPAVAAVVSAMGGLGLGLGASRRPSGGGAPVGRGGSGAVGGGGRTSSARAKQIGRAIAGLGGFANVVQDRGLTEALRDLGLQALEGRPAVEVIARVSERLSEQMDGVDREIVRTALNETILDAAQLEQELGYTDLEQALQTFFNEQGLVGFIELFLSKFVCDLVTAAILDHVDQKTDSERDTEALLSGIEIVCRDKLRTVIGQYKTAGRLDDVNWFGAGGVRLGRELADSIVTELTHA